MDAIVLAGGPLEPERFPEFSGVVARKAELRLCGRPMVQWVVAALRDCLAVDRISVVGHASLNSEAMESAGVDLAAEREGIAENLRAGLGALPGATQVVMVSGDVPLLTPEAVQDLIDHAPAADVVVPYVERADVERCFPEHEWMFARTPDGDFTGCSAFVFRPEPLLAHWDRVERLLDARRRSVAGLAALIGPSFVAKYLLRRLRIADVERKMSALLGVAGRGYRTTFSELAMDVDRSSDVPIVERALRQRALSAG